MIRRPPRSTLFPTRRSSDLGRGPGDGRGRGVPEGGLGFGEGTFDGGRGGAKSERSEEHTSELQSLTNLVCRLLLEKKKKKKTSRSVETNTQRNYKQIGMKFV